MNKHEALSVFLGDWNAEGSNHDGDKRSPWSSVHSARWHSGDVFVVQDERANGPVDTSSLLGWDHDAGRSFARTTENHGFRQTIRWERCVGDNWVPLCDRIAIKI